MKQNDRFLINVYFFFTLPEILELLGDATQFFGNIISLGDRHP